MYLSASAAIGNITPQETAAISDGRKVRRPSNIVSSLAALVRWSSNHARRARPRRTHPGQRDGGTRRSRAGRDRPRDLRAWRERLWHVRARRLQGDPLASLQGPARGGADAHACRGHAPLRVAAPRGGRRALPGPARRGAHRRRARGVYRGPFLIAELAIRI